MPASHCQAMLGYALDHSSPRDRWRRLRPPSRSSLSGRQDIKQATNLLAYGNGLVEWMKAHGIITLPGSLADLKRVMTACVSTSGITCRGLEKGAEGHEATTNPRGLVCGMRLVGMCDFLFLRPRGNAPFFFFRGSKGQRRERQKLDAAAELLPAGCVVHGYLGDSFEASPQRRPFAESRTFLHKPMPTNDSECFEALQGIGMRRSPLTLAAHQKVRLDATATVRNWLKDEEKGPTPHLDVAISVEHRVPVRWDHQQDHMEIYNATDGVWSTGKCDGACKGEMLARALIATYGARTWRPDPVAAAGEGQRDDLPYGPDSRRDAEQAGQRRLHAAAGPGAPSPLPDPLQGWGQAELPRPPAFSRGPWSCRWCGP